MELTVLAASGRTGLAITRQALRRGHTVTAIARDPERITLADSPRLQKRAGDVNLRGGRRGGAGSAGWNHGHRLSAREAVYGRSCTQPLITTAARHAR